jgi:uncharacterized membrane protein
MDTKDWNRLTLLIIGLVIIAAAYFYQVLPDQVVTHWNAAGEPDGWGGKNFATFFVPALLIGMYLLFQWLPKLDPKKANYLKFASTYKVFQFIIILFLAFIYFISSVYNLGVNIPIGLAVSGGIGLMMIVFGFNMNKIKSNWFIGIRTPWTLSSEVVWKKTHEFAGKVFIVGGLFFILASFLGEKFFVPVLIIIILLLLSPMLYSYLIFRDQKKNS